MRTHLFSIFQSCWQNYEHVMVLLKLKRELMTDEVSFRAIIATVKCYNNRFFTILKFHFISFSHWQLRFSKFSKCIPAMPSSERLQQTQCHLIFSKTIKNLYLWLFIISHLNENWWLATLFFKTFCISMKILNAISQINL